MSTPPTRRYTLIVSGPAAQVSRSGPSDILRVGIGKNLEECLTLAGLLFPICPRAHQIAALRAAEHASGITLTETQVAARDVLLNSEGVFSAVWRAALSWSNVLKIDMPVAAVQLARMANDGIPHALFSAAWAKTGGADITVKPDDLARAVGDLAHAFDLIQGIGGQIQDVAARVSLSHLVTHPVGDALLDGSAAAGDGLEETPRTLHDGPVPTTLAPWFEAQMRHASMLLAQLQTAAEQVASSAQTALPAKTTGSGLGIAMTARGRLRHAMTLKDGMVTHWSAKAPTDWNFSKAGAAACAASALERATEESAALLVAALDPCAPCDIQVEPVYA